MSALLQMRVVALGKSAFIFSFSSVSTAAFWMAVKCHVWKFMPLGAYAAASSIRFKSPAETCRSV